MDHEGVPLVNGSGRIAFRRPASRCLKIVFVVFSVLCLLFLALGFSAFYGVEPITYATLRLQLPIRNDTSSITYSEFMHPNVSTFMEFWLYHIENPEDVSKGKRPRLKQIGPFVYSENRTRGNASFQDNSTLLSYREKKQYLFDKDKSSYGEEYRICTISMGKVAILSSANSSLVPYILQKIEKVSLFQNITAREMIWGYEDPALKIIANAAENLGINVTTRVGIMVNKNDTYGPVTVINTGVGVVESMGTIKKYNGTDMLHIWNSSYANAISGTDGTLFHPFLKRDDVLHVFSSELCRSIYFNRVNASNITGLPVYEFKLSERVFMNSTLEPTNVGFCVPKCYDSGVLDVSVCQPGNAPVIMSQPQFIDAAKQYKDSVIGLKNESDTYRTTFYVEPITGALVHGEKLLQVNFDVQPSDAPDMRNITPVILPIAWMNESTRLSVEDINKLYASVYALQKSGDLVALVLWFLAGICASISMVTCCIAINRKSRGEHSIINSESMDYGTHYTS